MNRRDDSRAPCICVEAGGNWPKLSRQWRHVGPPLRPVEEDLGFVQDAALGWTAQHGAPRVLLLGVTPELYRLPWPPGTDFLSVDHTQEMIDNVWPGPREAAICAEWWDLHLPAGSRDIALCDGGLQLNTYPEKQRRVVAMLRDAIAPGGLSIFRLYAPAGERESLEDVLRDLSEGRMSNMNILKLRIGMAMTEDAAEGVELDAMWRAVHEVEPDLQALADRIGWDAEDALVLNTYRGSKLHYHFATAEQVREMFCEEPGGFEQIDVRVPSYEMGERFPTVVFRRLGEVTA